MRKNKISEAISNINEKYIDEANAYNSKAKSINKNAWLKWASVAACLALVTILGVGAFMTDIFGGGEQIATLENGNTISFVKSNPATTNSDMYFPYKTRKLTESEIKTLFNDLPVTAYGIFDEKINSMVGLDGTVGDVKLIISAPHITLRDTIIEGKEKVSYVEGIPVNAGYFITSPNSKGERQVIYYASFTLGNNTVYVEHSGMKSDSEKVKNEITSVIQSLIELKEIDLAKISK